jgi:hypothetical protein
MRKSCFKNRVSCHERWDEAYRRDASRIEVMVVPQQSKRDRIEEELIEHCQPSMSERLKQSAWELAKSGIAVEGLGFAGC